VDPHEEVLDRAERYPYTIPPRSFIQVGDRTLDLVSFDPRSVKESLVKDEDSPPRPLKAHFDGQTSASANEDRMPVLAYGSNAAPEVLKRKFGDGEDMMVPMIRARLFDFDVVYSAHFSPYASIPATLQRSQGTYVATFVAYLTESQIQTMSETEPNYFLASVQRVDCQLAFGPRLTNLATYLTRHGCLAMDHSEIALADIDAEGRQFPTMSELQVLEYVRKRLVPNQEFERFIVETAEDEQLSRQRTEELKTDARDFAYEDWRKLEP
jgi:hypothetical protein